MIKHETIITGTKDELNDYFKTNFNSFRPSNKMKHGSKYATSKTNQVEDAYENNKVGGFTFGIFFYFNISNERNEIKRQYFYILDCKTTKDSPLDVNKLCDNLIEKYKINT